MEENISNDEDKNPSSSVDQRKYLVSAEDLTELSNFRIKKVVREMLAKYLGIATLVISALGYFGIQNIKESIQVSVQEDIYAEIKRETDLLEQRAKQRLEYNQNLFETRAAYIELGINETKDDLKNQSRYVQDEMYESILTMREVENNAYATAYMLDTIRYYYNAAGRKNFEYEQRLSKVYDKFGTVDSLLYRFNSGLEDQKNQISRIEEKIIFPNIDSVFSVGENSFLIRGFNFGTEQGVMHIRKWNSQKYEDFEFISNDIIIWSDSLIKISANGLSLDTHPDSVGTRISVTNDNLSGYINIGKIPQSPPVHYFSTKSNFPWFRKKRFKRGKGRVTKTKRRQIVY